MGATHIERIVLALLLAGSLSAAGGAQPPIIDADFARGDFRALGWKVTGDWDVFRYPKEPPTTPGPSPGSPPTSRTAP